MKPHQIGSVAFLSVGLSMTQLCLADTDPLSDYCVAKGGMVTPMTAWFETNTGPVAGLTEKFCTFERDKGYIVIGLSAFASEQSNIAATYMKTLPEFKEDSDLMRDKSKPAGQSSGFGMPNPSYAVCQNLGGTAITYKFHGSFRPQQGGDVDICVFGDGSMVSAWSLIYMANHRAGYDEVNSYVKSQPIP